MPRWDVEAPGSAHAYAISGSGWEEGRPVLVDVGFGMGGVVSAFSHATVHTAQILAGKGGWNS